MNKTIKSKKSFISLLIVAAIILSMFFGVGTETAYAKAKKGGYFRTYNVTLDTDHYRYDNEFAPFLSYTTKWFAKSSIKGDKLPKQSGSWNAAGNVYYCIEKSGKGYSIYFGQTKISGISETTLVVKTAKKHKKILFKIRLDRYDRYGNIIRSDGTFEKKDSWLISEDGTPGINDDESDTGLPVTTPVPTSAPAPTSKPVYTPVPTLKPTYTYLPVTTPVPVSTSTPTAKPTSTPNRSNDSTDSSDAGRMKKEASEYGVTIDVHKVSENDLYSWDFAKPKNTAEKNAFDRIVEELRQLCQDPDDTLANHRWVNENVTGEYDRSGQLYKYEDPLRTELLNIPSDMSTQRKIEIICNLYFLERTCYDQGVYSDPPKYEDEDKPYQRILSGTYRGVCGRGAMRALRILYCTNLGFVPHLIVDYTANHGWLVVESTDTDGTPFMRGFYVTANTFDMQYDIPLDKTKGWYESYNPGTNKPSVIQKPYYYVQTAMINIFTEHGYEWNDEIRNAYEKARFFSYWGGLMDILIFNNLLSIH